MIAYISAPKGTSNFRFKELSKHIRSVFNVKDVVWWDSNQTYDVSIISRVDRVFFYVPALELNHDTYCIGKGQYSEFQRCLKQNTTTLAIGKSLVKRELVNAKVYTGRPDWINYAQLRLGKVFGENKEENEEILLLL